MDDSLLEIFQSELATQCTFIVRGAHLVNEALKTGDGDMVWFALQGLLISASNASKLLWGSRTEAALEARRALRESVEVDVDSPLSSRKVRNDFEHFDERLERWFEGGGHIDIGRNIAPLGAFQVGGGEPEQQFGRFDQSTATVFFWENAAELNPIVAEGRTG